MIFMLTSIAIQVLSDKLSLFLGGQNHTKLTKILASVNISMNHTVISSCDYNCTVENGCTTDMISYNVTNGENELQFYKAFVAVNLIDTANTGALEIVYIYNDTLKVGSVLGLSPESKFMQYYFEQNKQNGLNISFSVDFENKIKFEQFDVANYILLPVEPYNITITDTKNEEWKSYSGRVCLSNSEYDSEGKQTIMGVSANTYQKWVKFIKNDERMDNDFFTFFWVNQESRFVTQMNYVVSDFIGENNTFLIHNVPDKVAEKYGCEIFTGPLMLKKYDFRVVYSENRDEFVYKYAFNSSTSLVAPLEITEAQEKAISIWIILLVIVVIIALLYYVSNWYNKRNEINRQGQGDYVTLKAADLEMNRQT